MTLPRFFVDSDIIAGEQLQLPDQSAHHLSRVLRLESGDAVIVFNGRGGEYQCTIDSITKKQVLLGVDSFKEDNRSAELRIHLGMAVIKRDAMDAVLSKAVEMGVHEITPLVTERCTVAKKVIKNRQIHWQQVLVSACEQCGLNLVPRLHATRALGEWLPECAGDARLIAVPDGHQGLPGLSPVKQADLLVGPEGGFTDNEVSLAQAEGFESVTLGSRVMRAETAPVTLMAVMHHVWGDYQRGS